MPDTIKKGILEGLRVVALAVVAYLLTDGVLLKVFTTIQIDVSTKLVIIGLITSVLKAVDEWLHSRAVNAGWLKKQGLVGF